MNRSATRAISHAAQAGASTPSAPSSRLPLMRPGPLAILFAGALVFEACTGADVEPPQRAAAADKAETPAAEPPAPPRPSPPAPREAATAATLAGEPLTFTVGAKSFRAAVALASQYNGQRRIIVSSAPMTCAELLAIPEIAKKGRVSFIVAALWRTGKHPLASAEILDDDTREVTHVYGDGTIEVEAGADRAGERGKIKVSIRDASGGASGVIDVELCE